MKQLLLVLVLFLLAGPIGCAGKDAKAEDPVKGSKEMIARGHKRLYTNGGIKIPVVDLPIIAPGPNVFELSSELMGYGAANLFIESVAGIANSYEMVWDDTKQSFVVAGTVWDATTGVAGKIHTVTMDNSGKVMDVTFLCTAGLFYGSWQVAKDASVGTYYAGKQISNGINDTGKNMARGSRQLGFGLIKNTFAYTGEVYSANAESVGDTFQAAGQQLGKYGRLNQQIGTRWQGYTDRMSGGQFAGVATREWDRRGRWSQANLDLISSAFEQPKRKREKFKKSVRRHGVAFAAMQQTGYFLKSVFWDYSLKPAGKVTVGTVGLIGTNIVTYPVATVGSEVFETTKFVGNTAWQTTRLVGESTYDVVSPAVVATGQGALATGQYVLGTTAAGVVGVMTPIGGTAVLAGGEVASLAVRGTGVAVGETIAYAGPPVVATAAVATGSAAGATAGAVGTTVAAGNLVVGETAAGVTAVGAGVASTATAAGGTAIAVVKGSGKAIYGMGKSVVLPVGSFASGGVLLSYGTASQLVGQSVLLASDAVYLLVSMEGARWVLYEIKS